MRYRRFGTSGLRVSELALGAMTFGEDWGWGADQGETRKLFDAYKAAGGNFIDTANVYTNGTSERLVGELVRGDRERFVIATKYTSTMRPDDPNGGGNHRKSLVQSLEASLRRLATDYIDLFWVHAWDGITPTEEIVRALDDVVRAGKVLYIGISDAPAWVITEANAIAELRGWSRFAGIQVPYSLVERTVERELLPMAAARGLAVTTWGGLGGGALTGKYEAGKPRPPGHRLSEGPWGDATLTDRALAIAGVVREVATELDRTPSQIALAWVLAQRSRAQIIPILGARKLGQLHDNLGALELDLPDAALAKLDAASRVEPGFPHDFLAQVRGVIHGTTTIERS